MIHDEKRTVIEHYINAYNAFDIDGMVRVLHPDIQFKNIVNNQVNAAASGIDDFRRMALESKELFSFRKQTLMRFAANKNEVFIEVDYLGVLAMDLSNGMKKGETLRLSGRSEFVFRNGKIYKITDIT